MYWEPRSGVELPEVCNRFSGKIVARHHHRMKPLVPEIVQDIERVLEAH
jgi:hypothetical protein